MIEEFTSLVPVALMAGVIIVLALVVGGVVRRQPRQITVIVPPQQVTFLENEIVSSDLDKRLTSHGDRGRLTRNERAITIR